MLIRKLYTGRRKAREAVTGLSRMAHPDLFAIKVYVIEDDGRLDYGGNIVIEATPPDNLIERAMGAMALGSPETGNYEDDPLASDCLEFYQGRGLTRFRGL